MAHQLDARSLRNAGAKLCAGDGFGLPGGITKSWGQNDMAKGQGEGGWGHGTAWGFNLVPKL